MIRPSSGACRVLGEDSSKLSRVAPRIGSIVETPLFFPRSAAKRNLENLAKIDGIGKKAVLHALERVGLAGREKDLVRDYSLGMKQRLGLAAAILKDPELLILDEPAHGLDPAGIRDVRQLMRDLGNEGRTVFVSSHLLTEVQAMCDRVAIISMGKAVTTGPVQDVLSAHKADSVQMLFVEGSEEARAALQEKGFVVTVSDQHLIVEASPDQTEELLKVLARKRIFPREVGAGRASLEDVFLELTGEGP